MTIENLKQIAIKYATTKGSRVPLAPDELCNAVVQYFNEFLKITADINTIQVAVTEEGGNIVFTITGNTLDGKAFTPIVITVNHNDFVTNQEFEEFKTSVTKQLNNKRSVISSPASSYVVYTQANGLESNLPYSELANQTSTNIMARRANGTSDVKKGISGENVANMENIAEINSTLYNKLDKITIVSNSNQVYGKSAAGENLMYNLESHPNAGYILQYDSDGNIYVNKGSSEYTPANMQNIADVEAKIPDVTNLADVTKENTFTGVNHFTQYITSFGVEVGAGNANDDEYDVSIQESVIEIFHYISGSKANSLRITENQIMTIVYPSNEYNIFDFPNKSGTLALTSDIPAIPEYTSVDSVIYDTTNGAIIAYNGANEIHIPLLAGENVTIDASEDNKKIVISAAGGGGTGDVTAAGNNTFTGENTFTNEITFNTMKSEAGYIQFGNFNYETTEGYDYLYIDNTHINIQKFVGNNQYHEININANLMTYAPPDDNVYYEYRYPRKNGTFALTSDIPDTSSFVTLAGDNTFGGTNTFNNSIYAKNGVVAGDTTNYGANSVTKGSNTYSFPNKSGTFAMTTDVIKNPIYFISFYANEPSDPCHLIGTMMSKNSYGTGQKTNEEFAVMLADNLYTNSNEGLAAYGKLAEKDILCIYSEDGLSIRCLDEANSEVDLPTVMFFVMETEL